MILRVPRFDPDPTDNARIDRAFGLTEPQAVACCNWPQEYPYAPRVTFRMFHTGTRLYVRFEVEEECTMAAVAEDQGPVWTDSCCELFLAPDDGGYYNFETNCIGTMLLAFRRERNDPRYAPPEVMRSVTRTTTLPRTPFAERRGASAWSLTLRIPPSALFLHGVTRWDGFRGRMNCYKCGDALSRPHFLSWSPVTAPQPDFHRPEQFAGVRFD